MKILFVGNYDMAGSYLASRMYREGNEISWLTQSQEEELWGDKIRGKVYRRTITDKTCSRILLGEAIDCVIFLTAEYREGYLGSDEEYGSLLSVLSPVLHAAASVKVGKICFLSSENVENEGLLPPIFEELRAGERIITSFCREKGISSLILRLGCVFGEGTLKEAGYLGKILQSMKTEKKVFCPFTETSSFDVLCASDLADGAFRLLTMNASGMYEVITGYPVSAKTLYSMAAEAAGFQGKIEFGQKEHVCDPEGGQRIRMACGWMPFYLFEEKGMDFLKKNLQQEALAENAEKKKNKRKSYSFFYETGQNLLLFVIMCLASSFSVDWSDLRFVDVRLLYVILVAISFGMRQGLLATGLAIISYTLSLLYSGIDISYVFYSVESWIPFIVYGVAGAFAGYWSDKKNDEYEGLMNEYAEQTEKYQFLKELYREIVEVKNHLQKQIMITKDSFSRIYEITETLDSLSPRVVCSRTVKVMEEIMECDSVAIYVKPQEGSSYGRLLVCSAKLSRKLSPSIDFQKFPKLFSAMEEGKLFVNQELDEQYPAFAMPVWDGNVPIALAVLYELPVELDTIYDKNLFQTLVQMVQNNLVKAYRYQEQNKERIYLPGTRILSRGEFQKELNALREAEEEYKYPYSVARIAGKSYSTIEELYHGVQPLLRGTDLLGQGIDGAVRAVFLYVDRSDRLLLENRFNNNGIAIFWED